MANREAHLKDLVEAYFYDADRAFFNDQRPEVHDPASAELAWRRTLDFLGRALR